jgi:hypothetical protein
MNLCPQAQGKREAGGGKPRGGTPDKTQNKENKD